MPRPLSKTDRAWLKQLEARLWNTSVATMRANMSGHTWQQQYSTANKVRLKKDEWKRVKKLISDHELIVGLGSANFCFGLALSIFDHTTPPNKPEFLTSVSGEHLPGYRYPRDRGGFEIGWKHFAPLAQDTRNLEFRDFYKMEPIHEKSHYDY